MDKSCGWGHDVMGNIMNDPFFLSKARQSHPLMLARALTCANEEEKVRRFYDLYLKLSNEFIARIYAGISKYDPGTWGLR